MKKIFFLLVSLSLISTVYPINLDSINTNPERIGLNTKFSINAFLSGDSCGAEIRFYIDESLVSSKALGCDRISASSKTIDPSKENLECGKHIIRVELLDHGVGVMNDSMEFAVGNKPLINITENPVPEKEAPIVFLDPLTYEPLKTLNVAIYGVKKGEDKAVVYHTDSTGTLFFRSMDVGEYRYVIDDGEYCGRGSFYIKKILGFDGPHPANPLVGELVTLAVPQGVGIKVINSSGDVYLTAFTSLGGGVNFSINESGDYILNLGEMSSYWPKNINLTVSGKESVQIRISPEKVVRGEEIIIEVVSGGTILGNAKVTIEETGKEKTEYYANESGQLSYTPDSTGRYSVVFEGEKYEKSEAIFEAKNTFILDYSPKDAKTGEDVTVYVRDKQNNLVFGATVSVEDAVYGLTGGDGRYVFKVEDAGKYLATVSKEGFYDSAIELEITSPLHIEVKPAEIEIGGSVFIKVYDAQNNEIQSMIKIIKPSGKEAYADMPYIPDEAGVYEVWAETGGQTVSKINFTVKPKPLELSLALIKDKLIINTTSKNAPTPNINILVEKEDGKETIATDERGSAEIRIDKSGTIKITANPYAENPSYGKISVVRNVVRTHDTTPLLIALSMIAFIALIAVALIYLTPRKDEPPKRNAKPYFSDKENRGAGRRPKLSG